MTHDLVLSTDGRGSMERSYGASAGSALAGPALYQLNAARSGRALGDYRSAESVGLFVVPVTTDADAYLKAAWWVAVAAQLQRSNDLATIAQRYYQAGATLAFGGSSASGSVVAILQQASREVAAHATLPQTRGIANFLNDLGQSDVVLRQSQLGVGGSGLQQALGDVSMYTWIGVGLFLATVIVLSRVRE